MVSLGAVLGDDRVGPGEQDRELIAAVTRHHVVGTRRLHEMPRDHIEHEVARRVAERVIVRLETIDVDHDHRERRVVNGREGEVGVENLIEPAAIGQLGHDVRRRHRLQSTDSHPAPFSFAQEPTDPSIG
jgi:hypothetical protein